MTGRAKVTSERQRLDATFIRAATIGHDAELLSDFARYLCVLVAGFLEQAVIELLLEHVRTHSQPSVVRHLDGRLRQFTTANTHRIQDIVGTFDPDWREDLGKYLVDERKAAVDSIVNLRQTIAHGRFVGVTLAGVNKYYGHVKDVVDHIADLCDPA
jgi:RiboL-PSP-HEPN